MALMRREVGLTLQDWQLTCATTICSEDEPLCCCGVTALWPGVGVAWFVERQPWTRHPYAARIARLTLRAWRQHSQGFHYIEALVDEQRDDSKRLAEWLGFVPVQIKEAYGPGGQTMIAYKWRGARGC
jgi:hypothetical protein